MIDEEDTFCDECGEPGAKWVPVEYDAMVDGPGEIINEARCLCRECRGRL